jgi:hypothetical protein
MSFACTGCPAGAGCSVSGAKPWPVCLQITAAEAPRDLTETLRRLYRLPAAKEAAQRFQVTANTIRT